MRNEIINKIREGKQVSNTEREAAYNAGEIIRYCP